MPQPLIPLMQTVGFLRTIEIAWAMAWKPHPSQQQPLKPGSAKARLADALKVGEVKL